MEGRSRGRDVAPWTRAVTAMALAVALAIPTMAAAEPVDQPAVVELGDDEVTPDPSELRGLGLHASDPLGLLPGVDILRLHSVGEDVIDVWACGLDDSVQEVVAALDGHVVPYVQFHSGGALTLDFVPRGSGPQDSRACYDQASANPSAGANGVLLAVPGGGGLGGQHAFSESFPDNGRFAIVGYDLGFLSVAVHEYGHTQAWPHSFTRTAPDRTGGLSDSGYDEYDNAIDVMSGNFGITQTESGTFTGTFPEPYDTAVINRYAAGWIAQEQVRMLGAAESSFTIHPSGADGTQMGVIPQAGTTYVTLGARTSSTYDPIPQAWEGVEVYEVTSCPYADLFQCLGDERFNMGFREVIPFGRVSFPDPHDAGAYDKPLPHVIRPGMSKTVGGRTVSVEQAADGAYRVTVGEGQVGGFTDTSGSVFETDIDWLAASGITKGCNPPVNDLFCPDDPVTRGQMAAFLHRALPDLEATGSGTDFGDDDGTVFESDIQWLSSTGVTRGCNPPTNDSFCPDDVVTRGQMAAFIHRALPNLPLTGPASAFVDDDGSAFESDIEWLAATGVTRGCNPPSNDSFCPHAPVTRGAMAAFLHRALGG